MHQWLHKSERVFIVSYLVICWVRFVCLNVVLEPASESKVEISVSPRQLESETESSWIWLRNVHVLTDISGEFQT